jgi:hypothetical protein
MELRDNFNVESFYQNLAQPDGMGAFDEYQLNERTEDIGPRKLNLFKISNIVFDDVDYKDAPDFCDAYISSADMDGIPMSEEELELLNEDKNFIFEKLFEKLY